MEIITIILAIALSIVAIMGTGDCKARSVTCKPCKVPPRNSVEVTKSKSGPPPPPHAQK